jgi:hypothetical protein
MFEFNVNMTSMSIYLYHLQVSLSQAQRLEYPFVNMERGYSRAFGIEYADDSVLTFSHSGLYSLPGV